MCLTLDRLLSRTMVNWDDPVVELRSAHIVLWFISALSGLYAWEMLVSFDFDWQCFTRQRPFRWTLVPYFIARYGVLWALTAAACAMNMLSPTEHCTAIWKLVYVGAHASVSSAALLLVIRAVAIADHSRIVMVVLGCLWLAQVGTAGINLAKVSGTYSPALLACAVENTVMTRPTIIAAFAVHLACLALILAFLARTRGLGLWRLLISQGLVYFAVTMVAYVSGTVVLSLNLSDSMNLSLQTPAIVSVVICACRLYRSLATYGQRGEDEFTMTTIRMAIAAPQAASHAATTPVLPVHSYKIEDAVRSSDTVESTVYQMTVKANGV